PEQAAATFGRQESDVKGRRRIGIVGRFSYAKLAYSVAVAALADRIRSQRPSRCLTLAPFQRTI
ncbi:MAG TPA: hypothetical protein VGM32_01950, partial [Rhodopila sp.]